MHLRARGVGVVVVVGGDCGRVDDLGVLMMIKILIMLTTLTILRVLRIMSGLRMSRMHDCDMHNNNNYSDFVL